jgi:hypothetical protein
MSSTVQTPRPQAIHPEGLCLPKERITFPAHAWHIPIPDLHMDIRLSYGEKLTWAARAACSRWRAAIERRAVENLTHLDFALAVYDTARCMYLRSREEEPKKPWSRPGLKAPLATHAEWERVTDAMITAALEVATETLAKTFRAKHNWLHLFTGWDALVPFARNAFNAHYTPGVDSLEMTHVKVLNTLESDLETYIPKASSLRHDKVGIVGAPLVYFDMRKAEYIDVYDGQDFLMRF